MDHLSWKFGFKHRNNFMHRCKAVLFLEFGSWLSYHISGCCISLMDTLWDRLFCLCVFCVSGGTHGWTLIVESCFHMGFCDEGIPLGCCLLGNAKWYLAVVEIVWVPAELPLKVGLCQRPQIFLCLGWHRRRQSPSSRVCRVRSTSHSTLALSGKKRHPPYWAVSCLAP